MADEMQPFEVTFDDPARTIEALDRTLSVARRASRSAMTPGEAMAIQAVQEMRDSLRALAVPEQPEEDGEEPVAEGAGESGSEANLAADPPEDDEPVSEEEVEDLVEPLGELGEALMEAGLVNRKMLREASDETLLAVRGVGPAKLRHIREFLEE